MRFPLLTSRLLSFLLGFGVWTGIHQPTLCSGLECFSCVYAEGFPLISVPNCEWNPSRDYLETVPPTRMVYPEPDPNPNPNSNSNPNTGSASSTSSSRDASLPKGARKGRKKGGKNSSSNSKGREEQEKEKQRQEIQNTFLTEETEAGNASDSKLNETQSMWTQYCTKATGKIFGRKLLIRDKEWMPVSRGPQFCEKVIPHKVLYDFQLEVTDLIGCWCRDKNGCNAAPSTKKSKFWKFNTAACVFIIWILTR